MDETPVEPSEPERQSAEAAGPEQPGPPAVDIVALAEKVYRLMLAEIRLDRARGLASDHGE